MFKIKQSTSFAHCHCIDSKPNDANINNFTQKIKNIFNFNVGIRLDAGLNKRKVKDYNGVRFLDKTIYKSYIRHSLSNTKPPLVALYGFSDSQLNTARFIRNISQDYCLTTIASLNYKLGLALITFSSSEDATNEQLLEKIFDLSKDIISRDIKLDSQLSSKSYSEILLDKWVKYLQEGKNKLDIFSYVNSKEQATEQKNALIKKLIFKNATSHVDTNNLVEFIMREKLFDYQSIRSVALHLKEMNDEGTLSTCDLFGIFELIQKHFFRNSSKLGIEFFRENSIPIVSSWNKPSFTKSGKISTSEVYQRPYNDNSRRRFDKKETDEPITYSEIRHMNRWYKDDVDGICRVFLSNRHVEFSTVSNHDQWIKHRKSKLLQKDTKDNRNR